MSNATLGWLAEMKAEGAIPERHLVVLAAFKTRHLIDLARCAEFRRESADWFRKRM